MRQFLVRGGITMLSATAVLFVSLPAGAASAATRAHARPNIRVSHGVSNNWSGYALTGTGPYQSVSSSWTQPAVNCEKTRNAYSAFWIGLDGYTSETVEQTGTEGMCSKGAPVYTAWYEMYPKYPVTYKETVLPGDSFTSSVQYLGRARFKLTLSDTTQGWSKTVTKRLRSAERSSAEVIAEAPSSSLGVLPLADFGTVDFSGFSVDGALVSSSTPGVEPITMAGPGGKVKAEPSALSDGSFSDTWYSQ